MDESAEQIASAKAGGFCSRRRVAAVRREQLEGVVWPVLVVVAPADAGGTQVLPAPTTTHLTAGDRLICLTDTAQAEALHHLVTRPPAGD